MSENETGTDGESEFSVVASDDTIDKTAQIGHHTVAPTESVSEQTVFLEAEIGSKRIRERGVCVR